MILGGSQYDTHGCVNTQLVNNIIVNNEAYGISHSDGDGIYDNVTIDHNLYYWNGWRSYENGGMWKPGAHISYDGSSYHYYQTLAEVQANTPWEIHGVAGDPSFWDYDPDDHDLHDGSWPDFHLTAVGANAIDNGTDSLADSLAALLEVFDVDDPHWGGAYDVGRYEAGFAMRADPYTQFVDPGGTAHYVLRLHPSDLPHTVTLTIDNPSPHLILALDPTTITSGATATLTVTDTHTGSVLVSGLWYTLPITGSGGGFTRTVSLDLLVGGGRMYLPLAIAE